jgi:hypothetical protein
MSKKYRPYFSQEELEEVIRCVKLRTTSLPLLQYLQSFQLKIQNETLTPQYQLKPTLEQKLGISSSPSKPNAAFLHKKWTNDPSSLTPSQILIVQQYRWEMGLMTPEEADSYEANLFDPHTKNS